MKKRQISYAYVSLILMALIFVTVLTGIFSSLDIFVNADKTQLEEQHEAKIASYSNIEENYNGKLFVVMDRYSSGINKKQNKKFAKLGCINSIKDLTAISGDVESKKYLNKKEFRQILELDMTDSSRKDISKIVKKIEKIEGVLWVGVENAISFDTEVEEKTTLANDSISYNSLPVATEGIRYQVQWGLHRTNGINVEGAWNYSTGSKSVKVGIIDSGIANHEELKPNLLPGWDFYNDNDITTDDVVGHGTHVAGIIGATGTTPHGVVGVCPNIKLVPLQVDNSNHMVSPSAVIKAITWSIDNDIDLINFSIGSYDEDEALKTAISNYQGLFVCSAGNDANNNSATPYYPSNYSQHQTFSNRLISVGAIAATGEIASFSNYGSNVSLYAPGVQIMSTYPKELDETGYKYKDGTSMATPFVTGVAALLYSKYLNNAHKISDSEIAAHIKNTILTNATKDGRYTYKCFSEGRLDAEKTLKNIPYRRVFSNFGYITDWYNWRGKVDLMIYSPGAVEVDDNGEFVVNWASVLNFAVGSISSFTAIKNIYCSMYFELTNSAGEIIPIDGKEGHRCQVDVDVLSRVKFTDKTFQINVGDLENDTYTLTMSSIAIREDEGFEHMQEFKFRVNVNPGCVTEDTMVTLADGSQVAVSKLKGDENLLVWNMFTGSFDTAPILFIDKDCKREYEIINLYFSDGSSVKVIDEHGFWNITLNKFVFIRKDAKQYIGHWFNKQVVDAGGNPTNSEVQLVDVVISKEYTSAWSPVTAVHMCSYVNGMLSMPGGTTGLINIFEVDDKTMTINYDSYLADIDKYGLFTYEEFLEIQPIPRNVFEALGGQYMKIAIGKGLITTEELKNLIVKYSKLWE